MREKLLEVGNLTVDFRTTEGLARVVDGVSFELSEGETLGVVGESGCGKSQTALAMLGLLDSNGRAGGSVRYRGQELIGLRQNLLNRVRGAKITMIFQDPMTALNPHLKIGTQLTEVLRQHTRLRAAAANIRATEWLAAVHIPDPKHFMRRYPHELSGGQRQRVMIAMSLLCEPAVLVADEPTTALDVTVQAEILALLSELKRRTRMALVFITHDLGVVRQMCQRVLIMYAGRAVESGPTEAVFNQPQHPYTQGLLSCIPRLDASIEAPLPTIPGKPPAAGEFGAGCSFTPRCRYAFERCSRETPPLIVVDQHRAKACHLDRLP